MDAKKGQLLSILSEICDSTRDDGDEIAVSCPFAAWSHKKGTDDHPSMHVHAVEGEPSLVYCFACQASFRTLTDMLHALTTYSSFYGQFIFDAREIDSESLEAVVASIPRFDAKLGVRSLQEVYPESAYSTYTRKWATYLADRGITQESGARWDIGYDERRKRVTIPVRNHANELVGCVGRTVCNEDPRYYNYWNFDKKLALLGENLVSPTGTVVVVEGPLDAVIADQSISRERYSVVSTLGAATSSHQADRIVAIASRVVIAFDGDKAGEEGTKKLFWALNRRVPTLVAWLPDGKDPGSLGPDLTPILDNARISLFS